MVSTLLSVGNQRSGHSSGRFPDEEPCPRLRDAARRQRLVWPAPSEGMRFSVLKRSGLCLSARLASLRTAGSTPFCGPGAFGLRLDEF